MNKTTVRIAGQHEYHLCECPMVFDEDTKQLLRANAKVPTELETLLATLKTAGKRLMKIRHIEHAHCWEVKVMAPKPFKLDDLPRFTP